MAFVYFGKDGVYPQLEKDIFFTKSQSHARFNKVIKPLFLQVYSRKIGFGFSLTDVSKKMWSIQWIKLFMKNCEHIVRLDLIKISCRGYVSL